MNWPDYGNTLYLIKFDARNIVACDKSFTIIWPLLCVITGGKWRSYYSERTVLVQIYLLKT